MDSYHLDEYKYGFIRHIFTYTFQINVFDDWIMISALLLHLKRWKRLIREEINRLNLYMI